MNYQMFLSLTSHRLKTCGVYAPFSKKAHNTTLLLRYEL